MSIAHQQLVHEIVATVISRLEKEGLTGARPSEPTLGEGVFERVGDAILAAEAAQRVWARTSLDVRKRIIAGMRKAMIDHAEDFSRREVEETGMGRVEDKIAKQINAANATPGVEDLTSSSWSGDHGLTVEEYAPYGVIAAVTPSTHPVAVMFNSTVLLIAPGNAGVFNVHPAAKHVSAYALQMFHRLIRENGGPPNLITMVREPTIESANELFRHRSIEIIMATGGPGLVRAAFASGKKVIAAGPGNPPVVVDETADLDNAARAIIAGASYDNNILCLAEKEAFVVDAVYDRFMDAMARHGAVRLTNQQIETLAAKVFSRNEKGHVVTSRDYVGKDASVLARAAGTSVPDGVRLLFGEASFDCLFVQEEQMMPYLPVVRVRDVDEGIELAVKAEHRYRHTAMIHSKNMDTVTRFAKVIDTSVVVVNGPSFAGNGGESGEGYFSHTISSPTGEGVCTPRNLARVRRLAIHDTLRFI